MAEAVVTDEHTVNDVLAMQCETWQGIPSLTLSSGVTVLHTMMGELARYVRDVHESHELTRDDHGQVTPPTWVTEGVSYELGRVVLTALRLLDDLGVGTSDALSRGLRGESQYAAWLRRRYGVS